MSSCMYVTIHNLAIKYCYIFIVEYCVLLLVEVVFLDVNLLYMSVCDNTLLPSSQQAVGIHRHNSIGCSMVLFMRDSLV